MTNWTPHLERPIGPLYLAIADQLAADIHNGRLQIGDRLPTHRELAWRLGVAIGTVTRAYAEVDRRGLISGEVGRGTVVRGPGSEIPNLRRSQHGFIDLALHSPVAVGADATIANVLAELAVAPNLAKLVNSETILGRAEHRSAGAAWLARRGLVALPEEVVVTTGIQHGTILAMSAVAQAGDVILTEQLTFCGVKTAASLLSIRLHGVAIDKYGLIPEAVDGACRQFSPKALHTTPTLHNPTSAVLTVQRREAIAEICRRYGVAILEDDVHGYLHPDAPPPLSALSPENTIYRTCLTKSVASSLRIGFLRAPSQWRDRVTAVMRATAWQASPLLAELASRLILSGEAARVTKLQRAEAIARQAIAAKMLAGFDLTTHPASCFIWVNLPEPWRSDEFAAQARQRRIGVAAADPFVVGRAAPPRAIRLSLSSAPDRASLKQGLSVVAEMLRGPKDADDLYRLSNT